jgi:DNA-binding FadR family transcriptional regulator
VVEKIEQKTVVEQAMERIKDLIASGNYKVNDKIPTQDELASMFGIGRNSIREAIKVFHYLGIVKSRTGRGTVLCDRDTINKEALTWSILLGRNDIFEMLELREVLERQGMNKLMRLAAQVPSEFEKYVDNLEGYVRDMEKAVEDDSIEELILTDFEFHAEIISVSSNSLFSEIFRTLKSFMNEEARQIDERIDFETTCEQHKRILKKIKTRDPEKAMEELDTHIKFIRKTLEEILNPSQPI